MVVIDENMARTYWPGVEPLGRRLKRGSADSDSPWLTVVGVVGNVKQYALDADSRVTFYTPHAQRPSGTMYVVARTSGDAEALAPAVVREARAIEPNVPVFDMKTMEQRLSESLARRRFAMLALGLFALVALALAAVGIYGVMSYTVAQRTREIGVRVALWARAGATCSASSSSAGCCWRCAGIGAGLAGGVRADARDGEPSVRRLGDRPADLRGHLALLAGAALLACYLPARRATKVDPMVALRCE